MSLSVSPPLSAVVLPSHLAELRPAQRVRRYLLDLDQSPPHSPELRLPGTHQLAEKLQVSPRTVATVFKQLSDEGRVRTRIGDGAWLLPAGNDSAGHQTPPSVWRVGLGASENPSLRSWSSAIYGGVLEAAGAFSPPVMVLPLGDPERQVEQTLARVNQIDGLILFPNPNAVRIRQACQQAGIAVVDLNPPTETATADFVSPDYFQASHRIGSAFARAGRRRVLFLTSGPLNASTSSRLRLAGLVAGLGEALGTSTQLRILQAVGPSEAQGFDILHQALAAQPEEGFPDAVYAAGDDLAAGALRALHARGRDVPEQTSVIGGNGSRRDPGITLPLTHCQQPLHALGRGLMDMLLQRLQHPDRPLPGRYLPMPFLGGQTTRALENQILECFPSSLSRPSA